MGLYTSISYLNLCPSTHSNGMNLYSSILPFHAGLQIILWMSLMRTGFSLPIHS